MGLPEVTFYTLCKENHWCSDGRKVARRWYKGLGSPRYITARDVVSCAVGRNSVSANRLPFYVVQVICRLLDEETANKILKEFRKTNPPCSWYVTRISFPRKIRRGHQLYKLLTSTRREYTFAIVDKVLNPPEA